MERRIGNVTHFYNRIGVAVLELSGEIKLGDEIHILGHITDLVLTVDSLEIDHKKVDRAGPGDEIALKVEEYVRKGDIVFQILD